MPSTACNEGFARSLDESTPFANIDLHALLQSVGDEATQAGMSVALEDVPHMTVRGRPQALMRCLENLISNAVKYGQTATVSAHLHENKVVVRVCDSGPGIPAADLERVFEPFVRLESSRSRATGGTGLGLNIVRALMHRQHGDVQLRNLFDTGGRLIGLKVILIVPIATL